MPAEDTGRIKEKIRRLPHAPGVYLMKDRLGGILYVGKAKSLKKRVASYFQSSRNRFVHPKIRALVETIADFDVIEVKSEAEALLLEGRLIKEWKPRYNTDFTDDKRFLLLRVDVRADIPKFRLTRTKQDPHSRYFGPFAHAGPLRRALAEVRKNFGVVLADASPKRLPDGTYQLYDDIRAEIYGHSNRVTVEEYHERVNRACAFLEGKVRDWADGLREDMTRASDERDYEKAARLRDILFSLEQTLEKSRKFSRASLPKDDHTTGLQALKEALELPFMPEPMECFDVSHISGTFVVASMVRFAGGVPDKTQYRRYRIRSFIGNDDYRAMEEVVARRYQRLADEGKPLPGLIVIDGGKGQLGAALKAFIVLGLEPPPIIGLAKKEETILFPDERDPLTLDPRHAGIRLLQRLRDEAHRFANTFNADLRSRRIRESILEDCPGLGEKRRALLMERFRNINRLKQATVDEISEVEGVGPKLAAAIHAFLHQEPREPNS